MPKNTIYVGRPSKWGNPYQYETPNVAVFDYKDLLFNHRQNLIKEAKEELKGKNLCCWCPLVDKDGNKVPCHADILLEIANEDAKEKTNQ